MSEKHSNSLLVESQPKTSYSQGKNSNTLGRYSSQLFSCKKPKMDLYNTSLSNFGKDAPKIIIGCSRQEPIFPSDIPGPGAYTPTDPGESRKIFHQISKYNTNQSKNLTTDVDFVNCRVFPEIRPATINPSKRRAFFDIDDTIPGPNYLPPSTISTRAHVIEPLRPISAIKSVAPGPGHYDPKYMKDKNVFYTQTSKRDDLYASKENFPGPGHYNPNLDYGLASQPNWSIGKKARIKKRRKIDPPEVPKGKVVGIDQFLVQLDPSMNEDECLRYIATHQAIRDIVREIMGMILTQKPENPVQLIQDHYSAKKEQRRREQEEKEKLRKQELEKQKQRSEELLNP